MSTARDKLAAKVALELFVLASNGFLDANAVTNKAYVVMSTARDRWAAAEATIAAQKPPKRAVARKPRAPPQPQRSGREGVVQHGGGAPVSNVLPPLT